MPTVLITGAARGLGLEFARQYKADGWDVVATARQPSDELVALDVDIRLLDVADLNAVADFAAGFDHPLDLLIANAGIATPFEARTVEDAEGFLNVLRINCVSPVLLVQGLLPRIVEAGGKAVALSSQMGSIADATSGWVPYRASKSALNMAWHALANEWQGKAIAMATLHPGWVQTDMGGPNATIDAATSVTGLRRVIDGLDRARSGSFLSHDGSTLPW